MQMSMVIYSSIDLTLDSVANQTKHSLTTDSNHYQQKLTL